MGILLTNSIDGLTFLTPTPVPRIRSWSASIRWSVSPAISRTHQEEMGSPSVAVSTQFEPDLC